MRIAQYLMLVAASVSLGISPRASAQTNPVLQHYRSYIAALERGDLAAAATEAQAALAASEARDGDGGRTAVLSLNLATVHLMAGRPEQARPAARRALDLARAGAEGVDPMMAEIVLARSILATNPTAAAAARLHALLTNPAAQELPAREIYAAAEYLGDWGLAHGDFDLAQRAWALAGAHPEGSVFGERYGLGRARTSEGAAIIMDELDRSGRFGQSEGDAAHALLSEAVRVLQPLSQVESPTFELTLAQQTYAVARAWMMALESKLYIDGQRVPETPTEAQGDADGLSEIGPIDLTRPRCMMRVIAEPQPRYPDYNQVAAVMLFFRVNAQGEIVAHQIAARAGSEEFAAAIERVVGRWRVERLPESPANCRVEANILQGVRFVLRN
ncbi:MAG: hypothetical protein ACT4OF_17255 [Caulobacteraceae bacterium]